ncbi:MAG: lipopolysaccharide biosynthesis protein [Thermoguttaceae bacterium]
MNSTAEALLERNRSAESPLAQAAAPVLRAGALAVFDQAVVSGSNFLTTFILVHACTQHEVGIYSLASTVVMFLMAAQANLISVPYAVYCHRHRGDALAEYTGSTLIHQLVTSLASVACFVGLGILLSFGVGSEHLRPATWVLVGAIPFILLREYARRAAMAHLAMTAAIAIDVAVSALQLAALMVVWRMHSLSAAVAYATVGAACATTCLGWWLLDRQPMRFSRQRLLDDWRYNWSFGRWGLMSQLTGLAFYIVPWLLASVHGEAAAGELLACTTLVGLSNLFVMGFNNFLVPKAARAYSQHGTRSLARVLRWSMLCSAVVLGGLWLVTLRAGDWLAGMVYGGEYSDTGPLIAMLALATFADAMGLMASTGLSALDRPAATFGGDMVQLVVTLGASLWLVGPYNAWGIALALVLGRAAGAAVRWSTLWALMKAAGVREKNKIIGDTVGN